MSNRRLQVRGLMTTSLAVDPTMTAAARAVVLLWDRTIERAEALGSDDWSRPTPDTSMDVRGLVIHLTTSSGSRAAATTNTELVAKLQGVRDEQAARLEYLAEAAEISSAAGVSNCRAGRLLQASCLDMIVHAHDLAVALGESFELDASPVVTQAARYLLPMTHHLAQAVADAGDQVELQIEIVDLDESICTGPTPTDTVRLTSAALVLLLSGRGQPEDWRRAGALSWSGPLAEAFVCQARLFD